MVAICAPVHGGARTENLPSDRAWGEGQVVARFVRGTGQSVFRSLAAISTDDFRLHKGHADSACRMYSEIRSFRLLLFPRDFASRLIASTLSIIFREMMPNCFGPIFTKITLDMGWVILLGSALSFVGLGAQPPTPDLGTMVADGGKYMPDQWWIAVFPAFAIMLVVFGFNILGDGIRDMLQVEEV